MLFHSPVFIKVSTQVSHTVQRMSFVSPVLISMFVHFAAKYQLICTGMVPFQFHALHPSTDITNASFHGLAITVHRMGVKITVDLVIIGIGMS